ncbi:hypothetical protein BP5796_05749 [Coleophoma crateriformis]|uniref:RNase H type-1 domain-containing protein n=1 Tax=Coleophoma crateriformis TaxID=565419 RepID=A0A3D8RV06_9HELO|nr:hypothetical protein BP5796_05749 [Coleophoma crateriformis]
MGANSSVPEVKSTPSIDSHSHDSALLTDRQKRRRSEKAFVERGFEGNITINPNPCEATRHAHLEHLNPSHWGDKKSRIVFWAKGCCSGVGIVSQSSPYPEQWVWRAYRVMDEVDIQMAEILAVAMALKIAKDECDKLTLAGTERPSKVVVYSSSIDALLRIRESNFPNLSGVRMAKAGIRVIKANLVAAYFVRTLGIEVELRWIPDGCEIDRALESNRAASEGAKYKPPPTGPDAFIKDIQAVYERKEKANLWKKKAKQRKQSIRTTS